MSPFANEALLIIVVVPLSMFVNLCCVSMTPFIIVFNLL